MNQLAKKIKQCLALSLLLLSSVVIGLPKIDVAADTSIGVLAPGLATEDEKVTFHLKTTDLGQTYRLSRIDVYDDLKNIKSVLVQFPDNANYTADEPADFECENQANETTRSYIIKNGTTAATVEKFLLSIKLTAKNEQVTGEFSVSVDESFVSAKKDGDGNLHYYQFFPTPTKLTWLEAFNAAVKSDPDGDGVAGYNGLVGHLATISSPEEQDFIYNSIAKKSGWLGGTRARYKDGSVDVKVGSPESLKSDGTLKSTNMKDYNLSSTTAKDYYWTGGDVNGVKFYNSHVYNSDYSVPGVFNFFHNPNSQYIKRGDKAYCYIDSVTTPLLPEDQLVTGGNSEPNNYQGGEAFLEFAYDGIQPRWNDLAVAEARPTGYYVEYEETDEIKEVNNRSSKIVAIKSTPNSIFEDKSLFPLAEGQTRLILDKLKMDQAGEVIANDGDPLLSLNGSPVNGTRFSIYDLSEDLKILTNGRTYQDLAGSGKLAPSLSSKAGSADSFTAADAAIQLQYQITRHITVLTDDANSAIPATGSVFTSTSGVNYQENGMTYVDVATTGENQSLKIYAIVQRDSNDVGTLYYEQPLIVALPVFTQESIERDVLYLYPKGFGEEVTKTFPDGDEAAKAVSFGEPVTYEIKIPIPKDIDQLVSNKDNPAIAENRYKSLSIIDEYPAGIVPHSYWNSTAPWFDLNSRRTDLGGNKYQIAFTGEDIETLKNYKGQYLTIRVDAQITDELAINQPQTTKMTYIADFYDEMATDTKLIAESPSVQTGAVKFTNRDETNKVISGHQFLIANKEGNQYLQQNGTTYSFTSYKADATTFTTDGNGEITINGLKADTYTLLQTKAFSKYRPVINQVAKILNHTDNHFDLTLKTTADYQLFDSYEIVNYHRGSLPSTGKIGAIILILLSLIGMYAAYRGIKKLRQTRSIEIEG
ncbi:MAG: hypothetical protein LBS33_03045 [Streptococcaceae bacterium]|jgi:hypothetical protein|nr:hypothetical protein [Streptococcaceae bacterium]